jgi:SAM-dependent methyltransferase
MANFEPLKQYMFLLLDELIDKYDMKPPFLDAGCGRGDVSAFLAKKGWRGSAVDFSDETLEITRAEMSKYPDVSVRRTDLAHFAADEKFNTAIIWDVLEHAPDDGKILKSLGAALSDGGYLCLSVPYNPKEWRWDDHFYGHLRRYDAVDLADKLRASGFKVVEVWDCTFPVFWLLRRIYAATHADPAWKKAAEHDDDLRRLTSTSALRNAWGTVGWNGDFPGDILWKPVYWFSGLFRKIMSGHEVMILARKESHEK